MSLLQYFNTIRYLKPIQIYDRARRKMYRPVERISTLSTRPRAGCWTTSIERRDPQKSRMCFEFLNQERKIESWNDAGVPKLWLYNLHYFEHPTLELMQEWIAANPMGEGNGWEPYPLSLRIANWIKWALSGNSLDEMILNSLVQQVQCLGGAVEYHLLANHLFANGKALVFAGAFFEGERADRWLALGLKILMAQLDEQVLEDGGHIERSPMYHSLILEDVLDLVNLHRVFPDLVPDWSSYAGRMLGWLEQLTHPDGNIAFFNDATFGIAPEPAQLQAYAQRLSLQPSPVTLFDSGYIRLENDHALVIFDAGPIGPDYQPGHAHADTLSFELSVHGRRRIVNSGISTYETNQTRFFQRGTAAHNTVRIDGRDSSEVWSCFRVARRARVNDVTTDGRTHAAASHDGYCRLGAQILHTRTLTLLPNTLLVADAIQNHGIHSVDVFFHLHPEADTAIELDNKLSCTKQKSAWFPGFNLAVPNLTVVGQWSGRCPVHFFTHIDIS